MYILDIINMVFTANVVLPRMHIEETRFDHICCREAQDLLSHVLQHGTHWLIGTELAQTPESPTIAKLQI